MAKIKVEEKDLKIVLELIKTLPGKHREYSGKEFDNLLKKLN